MANTAYTSSETYDSQLTVCPNIEPFCSGSTDLKYLNQWADQNIEREVTRGIKLRKYKPDSRLKSDYYGVDIDYIKLRGCDETQHKRKCAPKRYNKAKSNPGSVSYSTWICGEDYPSRGCCEQTSYSRGMTSKGTKRQNSKRCPMRIAELAVPTKRHCLETWRNNCNILPEYMVERLKQQVLDQKPVVQISDAVNCFKNRKRSKGRECKRIRNTSKPNACMTEMKQLSSIFCYKMARKLEVPAYIALSPELKKLSQIVSYDMSRLTRRKRTNINPTNKQIENEMSKKVAVWIANIVEDAAYKLLKDDLRDLEEEEGPVLDLIDDLLDKIMDIAEPVPEYILSDSPSDNTSMHNLQKYQQAAIGPDDNNHTDTATPHIEDIYSYLKENHDENNVSHKNPKDNNVDSVASSSKQIDTSAHDSGKLALVDNIIREFVPDINDDAATHVKDLYSYLKENHDVQNENNGSVKNSKADNVDSVASSSKQIVTSGLDPGEHVHVDNIIREFDANINNVVATNVIDLYSNLKENHDVQNKNKVSDKYPKNYSVDSVVSFSKQINTGAPNSGEISLVDNIKRDLEPNIPDVEATNIIDLYSYSKKNRDVQNENNETNANLKDNVDTITLSTKQINNSAPASGEITPNHNVLNEMDNSNHKITATSIIVDLQSYVKENHDIHIENNEKNDADINLKHDNVETTSIQINSSDIEVSNTGREMDETPNQIDDNLNAVKVSKESSVFDIESEDTSGENLNKLVSFSKIDLATRIESTRLTQKPEPHQDEHKNNVPNEQHKIQWNSSVDNLRHIIVFAPPNDRLLSDVDEPWPADIQTPTIKPSANVNKSITSMGKILERDEKDDILIQFNRETSVTDSNCDVVHDEISEHNASISFDHIYYEINNTENIQPKLEDAVTFQKTTTNDGSTKGDDDRHELPSHPYNENPNSDVIIPHSSDKFELKPSEVNSLKPTAEENYFTKLFVENSQTKQSTVEHIATGNSIKDDYEMYMKENKLKKEQVKMKLYHTISKSKIDYRVHHNTVPSWVTSDCGKGEPSDNSFPGSRRNGQTEIKKNEILTWINNLENIFANLKMWNIWVKSACRNITHLKAKTGSSLYRLNI